MWKEVNKSSSVNIRISRPIDFSKIDPCVADTFLSTKANTEYCTVSVHLCNDCFKKFLTYLGEGD